MVDAGTERGTHGQPANAGPQQAFEALAGGALAASESRAWTLFERAWPVLFARVQAVLRTQRLPRDLQEDCGQAALTRVWKFRTSYRGATPAELAAWMHRIIHNESARLLQRRAQDPAHLSGSLPIDASTAEEIEGQSSERPDSPLLARDVQTALEQCLAKLDQKHREVIELLYSDHPLTEREAVEVLGVSKSYVHVLRSQALELLAKCLESKGAN